jgi:hypothetical protein
LKTHDAYPEAVGSSWYVCCPDCGLYLWRAVTVEDALRMADAHHDLFNLRPRQ